VNLTDAWNAFVDQVAKPVKLIPGRHYKTVSQGKIVMARYVEDLPHEQCIIQIYGRGELVGWQSNLYGLCDHIVEPRKLLK